MMIRRPRRAKPVVCNDFVEQITAYLDGDLTASYRARVEEHLERCEDCARALAQWRKVIEVTGRLADEDVDGVDPGTRAELLNAFRAQPPAAAD